MKTAPQLKSGSKIGIDASLLDYREGPFSRGSRNFSEHQFLELSLTSPDDLTETGRKLSEDAEKNGLKLIFLEENLVDRVWHDRPPRTHKQIYTHPLKFSGNSILLPSVER